MPASPKLQTQVERAVREALIASLRDDPGMTVDKLIGLRKEYPEVGNITVGELMHGTGRGGRGRRSGVGSRPSQAVEARDVDTRSGVGREAYDGAVMDLLRSAKGSMTSAQEIRRKVGGTPEQARRALNRLIETSGVKYAGKARATRYYVK